MKYVLILNAHFLKGGINATLNNISLLILLIWSVYHLKLNFSQTNIRAEKKSLHNYKMENISVNFHEFVNLKTSKTTKYLLRKRQFELKHISTQYQIKMVLCYQNCSDLMWEKIALVIKAEGREFCKIFEITRVRILQVDPVRSVYFTIFL